MLVATVTDIIVGGVIAAAAGLLATIVQWSLTERSRKATERQTRLDRAASTVGRTLSLLRDINPQLFIGILPAAQARKVILEELWPRWEPVGCTNSIFPAETPIQPPALTSRITPKNSAGGRLPLMEVPGELADQLASHRQLGPIGRVSAVWAANPGDRVYELYGPASHPRASGLQGRTPTPWSRHCGIISRSSSR
jgi:hypothetical protein